MTCIGRPSLSLGRGAELVEAERSDIKEMLLSGVICANPSQSPCGDSSPQGEPSRALWVIHLVLTQGEPSRVL